MGELSANDWAIAPAPHVGDTFFTCALAEAFLARHGGEKVNVVVPRKLWKVLTLFPNARVAPLDPAELGDGIRPGRELRRGEPFHLRPVYEVDFFRERYAGRAIPFTRAYHDLLEVPFPSFAAPVVPEEAREAARRRMKDLELPRGRTVILVPVSLSLASFSGAVWSALADAFAARGYTVATNVAPGGKDAAIPGTVPLPAPIEEIIPVAEIAGTVVASRCGVCDVLAYARCDLRILYHRPKYDWRPAEGVTLLWDLGICGLPDRAAYYRMGEYEEIEPFVERVAEERS